MAELPRLRALDATRPPLWTGVGIALACVAFATVLIYPLKSVAPVGSLGVVYIVPVLIASVVGGLALGLGTSLVSAAALNFFHIEPTGRFTIADSRDWVAIAVFVVVAVFASALAELARARAAEAERRRRDADLMAGLARAVMTHTGTDDALRDAATGIADALGLASAEIHRGETDPGLRRRAVPLCSRRGERVATLVVPAGLDAGQTARLAELVPGIEALVSVTLEREALLSEAVETAALRRSDDLKTALLRAVSHDLRSPLTAIITAGHALTSRSIEEGERAELSAAVVSEGERLSRLVDQLLDLSRLEAGRAQPRREWIVIDDVLAAAREDLGEAGARVQLPDGGSLPALRADAVQLERAFANLLENGVRYAGEGPVTVRATATETRLVVRVIDGGPGIPAADRERIFEPFYRGNGKGRGSGLGLAIARGFVQANGGTLGVQSFPGQGTSFVVSLPLDPPS